VTGVGEALLSGRVALVTGGARGIGRATALALADAGADVVVGYRERSDAAAATVAEIEALGAGALAVRGDVAVRDDVRNVISATRDWRGRIDILVNNAGVLQQKPFSEITDTDWDQALSVNLKGAFICSQEVLPLMRGGGGGRIVNIASSGGQLGGPLAVHYSASKAGLISLTRSLARIAAPSVIVNCIAAGLIDTEMTQSELASDEGRDKLTQIPLARPGKPAEVAAAVLFLASSASYVTGQTINVNGGLYLG
jgi:NAD(P)-dependent dehydrogenase (short-subunit alcohol dehydrogenase family)